MPYEIRRLIPEGTPLTKENLEQFMILFNADRVKQGYKPILGYKIEPCFQSGPPTVNISATLKETNPDNN